MTLVCRLLTTIDNTRAGSTADWFRGYFGALSSTGSLRGHLRRELTHPLQRDDRFVATSPHSYLLCGSCQRHYFNNPETRFCPHCGRRIRLPKYLSLWVTVVILVVLVTVAVVEIAASDPFRMRRGKDHKE